ncbi:glycosyltransferase [Nocardia nova]|uniref:glycosyltransferase n=1 Tax=Nocardia nova TaxID=37330 RepID=UPI0033CA1065
MGMLFVPYSAWGHVMPMLAVVAELTNRGVPVRVLAGSPFRSAVEAAGARIIVPAVAHDVRVPAGFGPAAWTERSLLRYRRRIAWRSTAAALESELTVEPPEVCVVDPHIPWAYRSASEFGGRVVPFWTTHAPRLFEGGPVLVNTLPELQPGRKPLGRSVHFVGPLVGAGRPDDSNAQRADSDSPVLVVALGTVFARPRGFFCRIVDAFAGSDWTVMLATGRLPVRELGAIPPNIMAHQWIPQSALLRGADVFVTHAGMNSVHEALVRQVPMLLAPRSHEQRQTADKLVALGIAERIGRGGGLLEQAQRLASDPSMPERFCRIAADVRAATAAREAADLLVGIAEDVKDQWRCQVS